MLGFVMLGYVRLIQFTIIGCLVIIHHPVFYVEQRFGNWTLPSSSGKKPTQLGPVDRASRYPEPISTHRD
jgi:hypothetical protein